MGPKISLTICVRSYRTERLEIERSSPRYTEKQFKASYALDSTDKYTTVDGCYMACENLRKAEKSDDSDELQLSEICGSSSNDNHDQTPSVTVHRGDSSTLESRTTNIAYREKKQENGRTSR